MTDLPRPDDSFSAPVESQVIQRGIPASWFEAYREGNKLTPQTTIGINVHVMAAVLEEPPVSWKNFSTSRLSQPQLDELGQRMTDYHRNRGIPHAFVGSETEQEKAVTRERVAQLWTSARTRTINSLIEYTTECREDRGEYVPGQAEADNARELDRYFATSAGAEDLSKLKAGVLAARDILRGKDARQLAAEYRELLLESHVKDPSLKYDSQNRNERNRRLDLIQKMVREALSQRELGYSVEHAVVRLI